MYTITKEYWIKKLKELGEVPTEAELIGDKIIVKAYYNNRWYLWELIE